MKKTLVIIIFPLFVLSCNSHKKNTQDEKSQNEVGIQNVNGNLPDTTNAINLSTHKKDSSAVKDSLK